MGSHSGMEKAPGSRRQDSNKKRTNTSHCFFHQAPGNNLKICLMKNMPRRSQSQIPPKREMEISERSEVKPRKKSSKSSKKSKQREKKFALSRRRNLLNRRKKR